MERELTIKYWIKTTAGAEPKPAHVYLLQESCLNRVTEALREGYTSGELLESVRTEDTDPGGGVEYRGWWEVNK